MIVTQWKSDLTNDEVFVGLIISIAFALILFF